MFRFALFAAASLLALSGCDPGGGNESADAANGTAKSRTENGQITARVQGVDLKVNLPPPIRRMTEEGDLIYPGARRVRNAAPGDHFHSDDPPETVARWYRDPARASRFTIDGAQRQDPLVLAGRTPGGDPLSITLVPGAGGGTDGIVLVTRH